MSPEPFGARPSVDLLARISSGRTVATSAGRVARRPSCRAGGWSSAWRGVADAIARRVASDMPPVAAPAGGCASTSGFRPFATRAGFAAADGFAEDGAAAGVFAGFAEDFGDAAAGALSFVTDAAFAAGTGADFPTLIAPCGSILGRREGVRAVRSAAASAAARARETPFAVLERFLPNASEPLTRRESRAGVPFDIEGGG